MRSITRWFLLLLLLPPVAYGFAPILRTASTATATTTTTGTIAAKTVTATAITTRRASSSSPHSDEEANNAKVTANDAVAKALDEVNRYTTKIKKIKDDIDKIKDEIKKIEDSTDFNENDGRYKALKQRLKEAKDDLKEAKDDLKEANERRGKAREFYLQLIPRDRAGSTRTKTLDPFFSQVEMAHEDNDMLVFPAPIPLTARNKLYIRSAYRVIYEAAMAKKDESKRKYAIVTGTPGIGKSAFLYYVFWRMVKAKKRVFFITPCVYFDGTDMWDTTSLPLRTDRQFWTTDLWCLIDSADPTNMPGLPYHDCSILLVTTPRHDYIGEFKKLVPIPPVFYMPLWSRHELQSIAGLYPDATSKWENRFTVLGGVPRKVLEDVSEDPNGLLDSACRQCSLDDALHVVSIQSELTSKTKVVQTLIHLHSEDPYTKAEVRYASQDAVRAIVHNNWERNRQKMLALLESADGNPLTAAVCGYIFEPYAKKLLQKGGEFVFQELVAGRAQKKSNSKITVPSSPNPAIVAERVATGQTKNQLYVPKTSNCASIDAWMPAFGAFQMTVGKTHDLKDSANADIAKLGDGGNRLFWVLLPKYFESFSKKNAKKCTFDQFAILIPYPEAVDQSWEKDSKIEDELDSDAGMEDEDGEIDDADMEDEGGN